MARILSISYDQNLLRTRELILKAAGHQVTCSSSYRDAMEKCAAKCFDVVVIGHSIPKPHKLDLIECFRQASPQGAVLVLTRFGEDHLNEADCHVDPWQHGELVRSVARFIDPGARKSPLG